MTIMQVDDWNDWLIVEPGDAPLVLSVPHAGTRLPGEVEMRLVSPWLARKDTDWYVDRLYSFAGELGATIIRTLLSRTVIDVNRDPEGRSLYPGQATTELCPTTTFDGEPLYPAGREPDARGIAARRARYYAPYHDAISAELARLRKRHDTVALFDAHSIRSVVPRLFEGTLPVFNLGTNSGRSCAPELAQSLQGICAASGLPTVVDGRFKGGYITRQYGQPERGVHAVQLELAMRGYLEEPTTRLREGSWPPRYEDDRSARADPNAAARGRSVHVIRRRQLVAGRTRMRRRMQRARAVSSDYRPDLSNAWTIQSATNPSIAIPASSIAVLLDAPCAVSTVSGAGAVGQGLGLASRDSVDPPDVM